MDGQNRKKKEKRMLTRHMLATTRGHNRRMGLDARCWIASEKVVSKAFPSCFLWAYERKKGIMFFFVFCLVGSPFVAFWITTFNNPFTSLLFYDISSCGCL